MTGAWPAWRWEIINISATAQYCQLTHGVGAVPSLSLVFTVCHTNTGQGEAEGRSCSVQVLSGGEQEDVRCARHGGPAATDCPLPAWPGTADL